MKKLLLILLFTLVACTGGKKKANYHFIKGLNEYQREDKIKALENYQRAYELDRNNIEIIKELAYLYADLGNIKMSKEFYIKALDLKPYDENSLDNLLKILYGEENVAGIEKYSEQILDRNSLIYEYAQMRLALFKRDYRKADNYLWLLVNNKKYEDLTDRNLYKYYLEIQKNLYGKSGEYSKVDIYKRLYPSYTNDKVFIKDYIELLNQSEKEKVLLKAIVEIEDNNDLLVKLAQLYYENRNKKKFNEVKQILKNKSVDSEILKLKL